MSKVTATEIGGEAPTNGAASAIEFQQPYVATVAIEGIADILFHRWNPEAVDAKATAAKGSRAKKSDDVESYVYRNDAGDICVPGEYLRQAIIAAAKFRQDPRSPRKSAMDLFRAGVVSLTPLASLGTLHDHAGSILVVPIGWRAIFDLQVMLPEYITPQLLNEVAANAGRLIGFGDFRPTYGRFVITSFSSHLHA